MKREKRKLHDGMLVLFIVGVMMFGVGTTSAFGISSSFWEGHPLSLAPGESYTVELTLQNMVGTGDVPVQAALGSGDEVATMPTKVYTVKAGTKDTIVPVEIMIPEDAEIGEQYKVKILFSTVSTGEGGGVQLGTAMETRFDVDVVSYSGLSPIDETSTTQLVIAIIVIVLVGALIAWLIIRRKRKPGMAPPQAVKVTGKSLPIKSQGKPKPTAKLK